MNHLVNEISPYLLQHAENPVDWYPWGPEALEKAKSEDKPIFLSIGYSACHWCHVMAHESFQDPLIAQLLNDHFVSIKVDREERPDLDSLYMDAVVAMTGQGGWPMSMFLTPTGTPFFGGTYFPPKPRYGMPSFSQILESIIASWNSERDQIDHVGQQVADHLRQSMQSTGKSQTGKFDTIDQAVSRLVSSFDNVHGGWGSAPKFPLPMVIDFLLGIASRGNNEALEPALFSLKAMARGGMYDVVGGGFHRYSTDNDWLIPHFEKMLYDNALLSRAYLHAYQLTGDKFYEQVCTRTLDYMIRELRSAEGGFFSSQDADTQGEEGKYYLWMPEEVAQAIGKEKDTALFTAAYSITEAGNYEGRNVLQRSLDDNTLATQFQISPDEVAKRINNSLSKLLKYREQRVKPGIDDKVLVSWNALAILVFAEAGITLSRDDYISVATRNANMLLKTLHPDDRLLRSFRAGKSLHTAYLEDYAALILALLAVYQASPDVRWYQSARSLLREMLDHYLGPDDRLYDTRTGEEIPLTRPRHLEDNATPSGNALAAMALLKMAAYSGNSVWRTRAETMAGEIQTLASQYPSGFGFWLQAIDFAVGPVKEIAIIGKPSKTATQALVQKVFSTFRPNTVLAVSDYPPSPEAPDLLFERPIRNGKPTAYVCQNFTCRNPVNDPVDLEALLNNSK